MEEKVYELKIENVFPNPNQPRKTFDDETIKELASSISAYGVISPIIVQPKGLDRYMIIAGERRYRAAKSLGKETIPAIIKNFDDKKIQEIAMIENLQREDLNPVDEALGIKQLMQDYDLTQEEVASTLGKSRSAVANKLRLLNLCREVLLKVKDGKLSEANARHLITLERKFQVYFASKIIKEGWSVKKTEQEIKKVFAPTKQEQAKPQICLELQSLVQSMERVLKTKIHAIGNNEKGRIYIDYFSHDDLDRLVKLIEEYENK
jgi:ParB family chromosome partitioning protein